MPWRETSVMDERLRFVARLLEGEGMSEVCRSFGISRKTGYKIFNRYKEDGLEALTDRSRRPVRYANQLPEPVEAMIVRCKQEKPHWGARKIRELLVRRLAGDVRISARSTVHAVLDRYGLVSQARKRNRANKAVGTTLSTATGPNDLWCADFKGEFKLGDGRYCYPLTITDQASRYLLCCEAFETTRERGVFDAFARVFAERGLPLAIRSDNGLPFASPNGLYNLSKLSVWWLRLGIAFERIRPGHPQENGRHERMHLTLKKETTRPPGRNILQQQMRFDAFVSEFNTETARGLVDEGAGRRLQDLAAPLRRLARDQLPLSRPRCHRHQLRPSVHPSQEDQHLDRHGRTEARPQGSRRRHLARHLPAL